MILLAIDPGPTDSAFIAWDGQNVCLKDKVDNEAMLIICRDFRPNYHNRLVIEQVVSYGMPVGAEVFETVFWSGRFAEAFGAERVDRIPRKTVCAHLCGSARAKDANVRQAIIDRFGGKAGAIGCKREPGPLYGVSGDCWQALALALCWWDRQSVAERLRA